MQTVDAGQIFSHNYVSDIFFGLGSPIQLTCLLYFPGQARRRRQHVVGRERRERQAGRHERLRRVGALFREGADDQDVDRGEFHA